jgi:hypothetical protein
MEGLDQNVSSVIVMERHGLDLSGSGWGKVATARECCNIQSGSINLLAPEFDI